MKTRRMRPSGSIFSVATFLVLATDAWGQPSTEPLASARGIAQFGVTQFAASHSFDAVFGDSTVSGLGGGIQAALPRGLFVQLTADRLTRTGQRVFVFEGQVFPLGIRDTLTIIPILITGGYRARHLGRVVPFGGAGVGWYKLKEESDFALPEDNVSEMHVGFHVVGGVEVGLLDWLSLAGEAQLARVPRAPAMGGVWTAFDERDLGGTTARLKLIIGRR